MEQTITDFLNNEYRAYARYTVESRAIPHFADGLKPVQRKSLAAAIRFAKDRSVKVSALGGSVMKDLDYHHGDSSVQGAITGMAQEWKQAMPWLDKDGQFGYLYDPVAGAPRYISVKLSGWTQLLLRDDAELKYNLHEDTHERIEPQYYLPLLPMLLLNGNLGIAVGFGSNFANRNPLEVCLACLEYLKTGVLQPYNFTPFCNGHQGLWSWWNGQFEHCAPWTRKNTTVLRIEGLPMNTTIEKYTGYLNSLIDQGFIKRFDNLTSKGKPCFEVHMTQQRLDQVINDNQVGDMFNLIYRLPTDNITCVMPNNSIRRFNSPNEVITEFVDFRLKFYVKRKKRFIKDINARLAYLDSLVKFIDMVCEGKIDFRNITKHELEDICVANYIDKAVLNVQVYNLTKDHKAKHLSEIERLHKDLSKIENKTERQMYIDDLEELLGHIKKFYSIEPVLNLKQELLVRIADA